MKAGQKVFKYIKADNEMSYGLDEEVSVSLTGEDVTLVACRFIEDALTTADGSLTIVPSDGPVDEDLRYGVCLVAHPFPVESRLWNGPDVIANNQYRSMLASLFHDLIWEHGDELAKAWGVTKQDVLRWGDGVLYALWMYASEDSIRGRIEARVAWQVCEYSRGWYHKVKKILGLHCLAFALLLAGCGTPPDWTVAEISGTNAIHRAMGRVEVVAPAAEPPEAVQDDEPAVAPVVAPVTPTASANDQQIMQSADEVDFSALNWSWGGFNGKNAKPVEGVEIGSLKVSGNLTYKWVRGGCEKLGATSREDADHTLACLFVRIGGKWQGGKFDWISTSRLSRDFKNVRDGYGGWRKDAIEAAEAYAFVICSKDGKRRSNVAMFAK